MRRSHNRTAASRSAADGRRRLRCAIYTRKSSDEGLEQAFNSLDAQRDACEAFIASQKHEGWGPIDESYDDGGFSGGSMERPALRRLLDQASKGAIDVVVVYKVDRLTRSLADFARLTDLFDRHGVSFVSVTQQFNTSTSMGRLTLNVLLSFAQFERELAGERIRDKIALSKRRGMWMGGLPPLGYDGIDRKLVINDAEAETVRLIFRRYLDLGSVADLKRSLDGEGIVSKKRIFADGRIVGGNPISRGALYQILHNRLYRGEIAHRGEIHQGNHEPIIDTEQWDAVQARLADQAPAPAETGTTANPEGSLLTGLLFDANGNRLTPTHATRRGRRYRYYISASLVRGGRAADATNGIRVPAGDLERLILDTLAEKLRDPVWITEAFTTTSAAETAQLVDAAARLAGRKAASSDRDEDQRRHAIRDMVHRAVVTPQEVRLTIDHRGLRKALNLELDVSHSEAVSDERALDIVIPAQALRSGKQVKLVLGNVNTAQRRVDPALLRIVSDAHRWFDGLRTGRFATIAEIARLEGQQVSHVSRTLPLAFLAPDIVEMIVAGRQLATLTPERLKERKQPLPIEWEGQREALSEALNGG